MTNDLMLFFAHQGEEELSNVMFKAVVELQAIKLKVYGTKTIEYITIFQMNICFITFHFIAIIQMYTLWMQT